MNNIVILAILWWVSVAHVLCQHIQPNQPIVNPNQVGASTVFYLEVIAKQCSAVLATGQSVGHFISLVERLETLVYNGVDHNLRQHMGAQNVAKLLLRRFRFDGYDPTQYPTYKKTCDSNFEGFNNAVLTKGDGRQPLPSNYYFPDQYYKVDELCSLYHMLSHNIYTETIHNANNETVIREDGVVSRGPTRTEAVALARVLLGVIAGLSPDARTQASDILKAWSSTNPMDQAYDRPMDPVAALTLADLWNFKPMKVGQYYEYLYGVTGQWTTGANSTTNYLLTNIPDNIEPYMWATRAEIRAGVDGYLIGRALRAFYHDFNTSNIGLTAVLRAYYSPDWPSPLNVAVTDRYRIIDMMAQIQSYSETYQSIVATRNGGRLPVDLDDRFVLEVPNAIAGTGI